MKKQIWAGRGLFKGYIPARPSLRLQPDVVHLSSNEPEEGLVSPQRTGLVRAAGAFPRVDRGRAPGRSRDHPLQPDTACLARSRRVYTAHCHQPLTGVGAHENHRR